jgi:hypothetical protein
MGFVNIDKNKFEIIFTEEGLNIMLSNGLFSSIKSFTLWDDNVMYTLNKADQPVPDVTGKKNNYTTIKNDLRNPLRNG